MKQKTPKTKLQEIKQYARIRYNKFKRFALLHPFILTSFALCILVAGVSFVQVLDKTVKKRNRNIEYIVVHYTANLNSGADARANAVYLRNKRQAGTHYCIDDSTDPNDFTKGTGIVQCTEEHNVAYAVGDRKWAGFVPKFWLKNKITNNNSLSYEMCLGGGRNDSLILDRTAQCVAWQLVNKGLDISHVVRHHDVSGKWCPKFNYNIAGWDVEKETKSWNEFVGIVKMYWMKQLYRKNQLKIKQLQPNILEPSKVQS